MIEIPESQTLARQLTERFSGKTVDDAIAGHSPHGFAFYYGDPAHYQPRMKGETWGPAAAVAGQVCVDIGRNLLVFTDGARFKYLGTGSPMPKKHQLWVRFDDGSALACSVQMYAGIHLYPKSALDNPYYLIAKEAPNPLTDAFNAAYFDQLVASAKPTLSAKALLATEQRIPGLGNGVLQDILFEAGVHPKRKAADISDSQREALYHSIKNTLKHMTERGGRDTEKDLFGQPGGYHTLLSRLTWQGPCPHCGGSIIREAYLGGKIYYCPVCQFLS